VERKSKLIALFDDEHFGTNAIDTEAGIMVNEYDDGVYYLIFTFADRVEVYLNLYDEEAPYRNFLGEGAAEEIEVAKAHAVADLNKQAYSNIH
jgi:hypothetical protein